MTFLFIICYFNFYLIKVIGFGSGKNIDFLETNVLYFSVAIVLFSAIATLPEIKKRGTSTKQVTKITEKYVLAAIGLFFIVVLFGAILTNFT